MANNGTKITAPIRVTDVKQVLGVDNNNVGYLCSNQHGKINMFSKYKPVRLRDLFPNRNSDWWRAYDGVRGNCGISYPIYQSANELKAIYNDASKPNNGWEYAPPRGVSGNIVEPFRLADFNGYYHGAQSPINSITISPPSGSPKQDIHISFYVNFTTSTRSDELMLADIGDFGNYYIGMVELRGGFFSGISGSSIKIGETDVPTIQYTKQYATAGNYTLYPALMEHTNSSASNFFIPLPGVKPIGLTISETAGKHMAPGAQAYPDFTRIDWILNLSSNVYDTFSNVAFYITLYNKSTGSQLTSFYATSLGTHSVEPNVPKSFSGTLTNADISRDDMELIYNSAAGWTQYEVYAEALSPGTPGAKSPVTPRP